MASQVLPACCTLRSWRGLQAATRIHQRGTLVKDELMIPDTLPYEVNWPAVYVVILNWNGFEKTRTCVESLERAQYPRTNIVIVDNGSKDDSVRHLRELVKDEPLAVLLENSENLGFARGCNVGICHAIAQGADYVLLLNNDSTVSPGFLEPAVRAAEQDPGVGLVGGKIYLGMNGSALWYAGGDVDLWRGAVTVRGFRQPDRGQFDRCEPVGFVTGAMMLIKRAVIETIGPLPAEYFFGTEEWDYSLAARRAGFRLLYVPEFVAYHLSDGSHSNADPKFVYNSYRNKLIFQEKFLPKPLWTVWLAVFTAYSWAGAQWQLRRAHADRADLNDLMFALRTAIDDHRKEGIRMLTEADLHQFSLRLAAARQQP